MATSRRTFGAALADRFAPTPIDVFGVLGYEPTPRQQLFHDATEFDILYGGAAGGGKGGRCPDRAAPSYDSAMETTVLTPKGFRLIGDLHVGDAVCNPDGTTAKVIGIFDNGPKQFYRVTLADGSTVEADADHLWAVSIAGARRRRKECPPVIPTGLRPEDEWNLRAQSRCRIVNTVELAALVARADDEKARGLRPHYVQIPLTNPVALTAVKGRWPVLSPYTLGALVGDGSLRDTVTISGVAPEVFDRIRAELPEHLHLTTYKIKEGRTPVYGFTRRDGNGETANAYLRRDGLADLHSWDKFIPKRIQLSPASDRFAFIQGLFDTDGHMDARGHVEFVTVSERLARDTQAMLRSLGYRATLTPRETTYEYKGEKLSGRRAYRLYVQGRHMDRLFHMPRKRDRVAAFNGGDVEPWHRVVSVEPTDVDNSRCIQVDNLNHLYVTDDFIVTHNTRALLMEGLRLCMTYPGIRGGAFRRTFPELEESLLAELQNVDYARAIGCHYDRTPHNLRFPNGSLLMFRYARNMPDATVRQGGQYQFLLFDEMTLTPPAVVAFLSSRLRSGKATVPVIGVRAGSNPGGIGHGAAKKKYIDATAKGANVIVDERGRTVRFIPSKVDDNPHVNAEYRTDLDALPDAMRAAFRDGSWDSFSGQVFTEWDDARHVVPRFAPPASWKRYNGIDYGWSAPWVVLWAAVDGDGRVWVYREVSRTKVIERDQARAILSAEAADEIVSVRAADPAMWARTGAALSVAAQYAAEGVHLEPASNDRLIGKQRVHSYLADGPACAHHRALGWETCPRLHVLEGTAPELCRTLPTLPYDPRHIEDVDTNGEDHEYDGLRYLLMIIGGGPEYPIDDSPRAGDDQHLPVSLGPFALRPAGNAPVEPDWLLEPRDDDDPGWP